MPKKAISVTLERENLKWLRTRAAFLGCRSVSQLLDRMISEARQSGKGPSESVVGTVQLDEEDPDLSQADAVVRALFTGSERHRHDA